MVLLEDLREKELVDPGNQTGYLPFHFVDHDVTNGTTVVFHSQPEFSGFRNRHDHDTSPYCRKYFLPLRMVPSVHADLFQQICNF